MNQLNDQARTLGKVSAYLIGRLYEENKPIYNIGKNQILNIIKY
jgi:hypothetical protein